MSDFKEYRNNELKYYVVANLLVLILLHFKSFLESISVDGISSFVTIVNLLSIVTTSSVIYVFSLILDSMFSGDLKFKLVYLWSNMPGETIFTKIQNKDTDIRFSNVDAQNKYKDIYAAMPTNKVKLKAFQNQQWYKIYHKYKAVDMVAVSAREFRLCRDLFISTFSLLVLYIVFLLVLNIVEFSPVFLLYMLIMLIFTDIATRVKGRKWVYNVIAHDIIENSGGR